MFKKELKFVFIIVLVGILLRAPLYKTPFWRTGDAVDYINVGRNLLSGEGLVTTVKSAFFNSNPVVSSAFSGRPMGMSFMAAGILSLSSNLYTLQIFSLGVGVLDAVIFYFLARQFFPAKISFLGGMLAALNPNLLISNRLFISEPVFILFIMLGLLGQKFWRGIFFGLAYLVRFEGIFLPVIFFSPQSLMAFCLVAAPYWLGNYLVNGNPFYSYNFVHFQVRQFQEYFAAGYGKNFPTVWQFISKNFFWVVGAVVKTTLAHLGSLGGLGSLGLLVIPLILGFKKNFSNFKKFFFFCAASVILYGLLWSAIFERARHFIPVYFLLLLPVLAFVNAHKKNILVWGIVGVTILSYIAFDAHRIVWARQVDTQIDNWSPKQKGELYSWVTTNTTNEDILCAVDPMLVNLFTERPAVLLPSTIYTPEMYRKFVTQYQVKYLLADDPQNFAFLEKNATFVIQLDNVRVYEN